MDLQLLGVASITLLLASLIGLYFLRAGEAPACCATPA